MMKIYRHREIDKGGKSEPSLEAEKSCYRYKIEELRVEHDFHAHRRSKRVAFHLL